MTTKRPENNNDNKNLRETKHILPLDSEYNSQIIDDDDEYKTKVTKITPIIPKNSETDKNGYLIIMYPPEAGLGKRVEITPETSIILGRHPDSSLQLNVDSVSRHHAQIDNIGGKFFIRDLGSTNGTYINDKSIKQNEELKNSNIIRVGTVLLKFLMGDDIEANYHDDVYRLTIIDALTEAYNKRYMLDYLDREIERSKRLKSNLSLIMIDIDHFKNFNDTYGHLIGDFVLREVAHRIQSTVRKNEIFARYGGEEFAIVLSNATPGEAHECAERARKAVGAFPIEAEGNNVTVTISLGVSTFTPPGEINSEMIIKKADDNLYKAKQSGRNCVIS